MDDRQPGKKLSRLIAPRVSIVICNYNYGRFLGEAIKSALGQTYPCQVIVIDDGSTDDSHERLRHVDPRVEVLLQSNGGQLAAYNAGLPRCIGDIVIFLDADDALEVDAVAQVIERFDAGVAKVHFRLALMDESGKPTGGVIPGSLADGDLLRPLARHGVLYASSPGSGNAYRRSVLERLFPLPVDGADRVGADFFCIYGAVAFGRVAACPSPLGRYRLHRTADAPSEALVFGNAALGNDEATKVGTRYTRFVGWLAQRTGGTVTCPPTFLDFSVQKSTFAANVLKRPYLASIFGDNVNFRRLLRAIWLQPAYGVARKLGLSAWAVLVLIAPPRTAFRLARRVCNPAARTA